MIKVFIGTEPKTEIARKVLEYSILKNTNYKVQFFPMMGQDWTIKPPLGVGTGFSLLRWDIPRRCNYQGAAIYLDADILCLGNIGNLWVVDEVFPNEQSSVWCTYQKHKWYPNKDTPETSVMLIDCAKAKTNQPDLDQTIQYIANDPEPLKRKRYVKIMRAMKHKFPPMSIPNKFNRLNKPIDPCVLLHYTIEPQQPWYNPKHEHAHIWKNYLIDAIKEGYITSKEVLTACDNYQPHTNKERGTGMNPYWRKWCV